MAGRARKKVLFYNPKAVFFTMPLGPLAVASHLDPLRYEPVIVDGRLHADPLAALRPHLDGALCLGVSVLTGAPMKDAIAVSRAVKALRPDLPVVWGGWHPSIFPIGSLSEPAIDAAVPGQGEETFAEMLGRFEAGETLAGCAGCAYRRPDGIAVQNPARPLRPVEELRPHDYGLLDVPRYFALKGRRQLDYIASQGCFFRCAFCADPFVYGRKWVGLSPERIGRELHALWERHRFEDVSFQDETFFTYPERAAAIARELLERKLPVSWAATMRADQGDRMSDADFALCRKSGLRRVIIGVESGSQETMDAVKKDIRLEQVFRCAERCRDHGIAVNFPFIVCFPGESDASIRATMDAARRLRAMAPNFQTPIYYYKPYPGTPITDAAIAAGFRAAETLEEWAAFDWYETGPWVSPERERLIERFKAYQRIAFDPGPAWRRPLRALARWRLEKGAYGFPLDMMAVNAVDPAPRLS